MARETPGTRSAPAPAPNQPDEAEPPAENRSDTAGTPRAGEPGEPGEPVESRNSGAYDPGPVNETRMPTGELTLVQANRNDLAPEEFAEGPYGAATDAPRLGKTSPWRPGQAYSPRFRDANPIDSDRTVPLQEPPADAHEGSIEGQN